jgi:hypothetical protein
MKLEKPRKTKKFEPYVLTNGDFKQLLARSRYFYTKKNQSGLKPNRTSRSIIWIVSWHSKAYDLAQDLRNIFENNR